MFDNISQRLPVNSPSSFSIAFFAFTAFMAFGGLVWGILCLVFSFYFESSIPFGYVILSIVNIGIWVNKNNFKTARVIQVTSSILLPFIFQWMLGGFVATGGVMLWSLLALIALLTFYPYDKVWYWLTVFILLSGISIMFDLQFGRQVPKSLQGNTVRYTLLAINYGMIASMLFFLGRYFIILQRKAYESISLKNIELVKSEKEREMAYQEVVASEEELRQSTEELQITNEQLEKFQNELKKAIVREQSTKKELEKAKDSVIAKKNENILSSLRYAKRIQSLLLPEEKVLYNYLPESFIFYQPKDIVSGDFYWFSPGIDEIIIAAVDCTGHGVPGAITSMIGIEQITEIVQLYNIREVDKVLHTLHSGVKNILKQDTSGNKDGMDMALCKVMLKEKKIEFSGAKNPIIYIQDNEEGKPELNIIKGSKLPIAGGYPKHNRDFIKHTIDISKPTACYLFTDGFQDQFGGEHDQKFMIKALKELLLKIYQLPMQEQKNILEQTISNWMEVANQEQIDDMLIIGFKV